MHERSDAASRSDTAAVAQTDDQVAHAAYASQGQAVGYIVYLNPPGKVTKVE